VTPSVDWLEPTGPTGSLFSSPKTGELALFLSLPARDLAFLSDARVAGIL